MVVQFGRFQAGQHGPSHGGVQLGEQHSAMGLIAKRPGTRGSAPAAFGHAVGRLFDAQAQGCDKRIVVESVQKSWLISMVGLSGLE
jgi:hypothetical protein